MIDGVKIEMGGQEWIVPPINLKGIRKIQPLLPHLEKLKFDTDEGVNAVVQVVQVALSRNYPEVTAEQIEDMVDMDNLPKIVQAIMNVSGLVPKAMTGAPVQVDAP